MSDRIKTGRAVICNSEWLGGRGHQMQVELQMVQNCSRPETTSSSVPAPWREVSSEAPRPATPATLATPFPCARARPPRVLVRVHRHCRMLVLVHGTLLLVLVLQPPLHLNANGGAHAKSDCQLNATFRKRLISAALVLCCIDYTVSQAGILV